MATSTTRRRPVQQRSRERVQRILRAAERIVVEDGVDALTTRAVADAADVPVGSLYQYFEHREAIIAALVHEQVGAMRARVDTAVLGVGTLSVRSVTTAVVGAYVDGYRDFPAYVVLWFRGRADEEVAGLVRATCRDVGQRLRTFAIGTGLMAAEVPEAVFVLAAEMVDAFLGVAYREHPDGDPVVIAEGIEMIVRYLEPHAGVALPESAPTR